MYNTLFQSAYGSIENIVNKGDTYIEQMKNNCSNKFWYDVFNAWHSFIHFLKPRTNEDIMGINLWNNNNIKINNSPVFIEDGTTKI